MDPAQFQDPSAYLQNAALAPLAQQYAQPPAPPPQQYAQPPAPPAQQYAQPPAPQPQQYAQPPAPPPQQYAQPPGFEQLPPLNPPGEIAAEATEPKKRGRKPKSSTGQGSTIEFPAGGNGVRITFTFDIEPL